MLLKNNLFHRYKIYIFSIVIFVLSVLVRLPNLGYDSINPDAVNWHYRCQQFANGIKYFQFEKTYPHYHPGVTLCHIMFFPTEVYKQLTGKIYNTETYLEFNFINSLALVLVLSFLISIISYLIGYPHGIYFAIFLNLEPFFFGNSKFIHLDILTSLLLFTAVISYKNFLTHLSKKFLILSSLFLSLAFLTKSVSIVFIPVFVIALFLLKKDYIKNIVIFLSTTVLFIFLLFPALWVAPIKTLTTIFKEADRVGVRTGHSQIILGNEVSDEEDPGSMFYGLVLIQKFSPLYLIGLILIVIYIFSGFKKKLELDNFYFVLIFAYLMYILVILISNKKLDRYLLILVPPVIYYISTLFDYIRLRYLITPLALLNLVSIGYFHPNQFLYFSPVLINFENSNYLISQKSFGMGINDLKNHIINNYGKVNLGFYDIKPMEAIYQNSLVWNIRETSPSKIDLVILSSNEKLPDKFSDFVFVEEFKVSGVPLYAIYKKNN